MRTRFPAFHLLIWLLISVTHAASLRADTKLLDQPMSKELAAAMLGRFGFGSTPADIAHLDGKTPRWFFESAIREQSMLPAATLTEIRLLQPDSTISLWMALGPGGSKSSDASDPVARLERQKELRVAGHNQIIALLLQLSNGSNQGHESLLSFWLNHFSVFSGKGPISVLVSDYTRSLEIAMTADSFESLLRASFYHAMMQIYLDNQLSTAPSSPAARQKTQQGKTVGINENLARELLELHTLGIGGGYSQRDIQELARIITGAGAYFPWMNDSALAQTKSVGNSLFIFDPSRHDTGPKTFLGHDFPAGRGIDEIDRALHIMAAHPSTAHHVSLKLAQRYLSDTPPTSVVERMAAAFRQSRGRISTTLQTLYISDEFQSSMKKPLKFKEPLDYILSASRALCRDRPILNGELLFNVAQLMGQLPLRHTTPDGYSTFESDWLSPVSMAKRLRFARTASRHLPLATPVRKHAHMANSVQPSCRISPEQLQDQFALLSPQTQSAIQTLPAEDKVALLLASPEFMRR